MKTKRRTIPLEGDLPESAAGRMYTAVIQRLLKEHGSHGQLLVTSPDPGAGRTTTAANLSLAFLAHQISVLLMEITNSEPRLENVFGGSPYRIGIEDVLAGNRTLDSIICRRVDNGLHLAMLKRRCDLQLSSEARKRRMHEMLQYARSRCHWTVIDGPSRSDAGSLLELADRVQQVLIVAGRRTTRRTELAAMFGELKERNPYLVLTN